ncbi:MAG: hypothetical protein ACFB3T_10365 [Geminicoccaceae bacterium]
MLQWTLVALALLAWPLGAAAEPVARVALHVDENDPQTMKIALNNAQNIQDYYDEQGEEVEIAVIANGPGLHMFLAEGSPVGDRIEQMSLAIPTISFQACGNTHAAMTRQNNGVAPELLAEVEMIPSGAVQLIELQQDGWAYLRP